MSEHTNHIRAALMGVDDGDLMDLALRQLDQVEQMLADYLQVNGRLQKKLADVTLKPEVSLAMRKPKPVD